jgi:hypothetical protein
VGAVTGSGTFGTLDVPAAGTARVFSPAVCASADACAPFNIEAPAISARKTLEVIIPHKSPKPSR